MTQVQDIFKSEKHSVWNNIVPIVEVPSSKTLDAYITSDIGLPIDYNELTYRIKNAPSDYTINLHINTPGGVIDGALFIIDAINKTPAAVTAFLTGTVASAGTIIALACDNVVASDHLSFMIHNYSINGIQGKAHEVKAYQNFTDANLNAAFRDFYSGFLTDTEMESVIDGQDLWLSSAEVSDRWQKRLAFKANPVVEEAPVTKKRGIPSKA